jgi:proteasome lid subunit RPN8/RPN11
MIKQLFYRLGDFLDHEHILKLLVHFCKHFEEEACGVIVNRKFVICKNVAQNVKNDFEINDLDWIKCQLYGKPQAIVHSHPRSGPKPSEMDMLQAKRFNLTYIIISLRNWEMEIYTP